MKQPLLALIRLKSLELSKGIPHIFKITILLIICFLSSNQGFSQNVCDDAEPFCSMEGLIFENESDGNTADPSIDYECLLQQPNPSWFFLQIDESGPLEFEIIQNTMFDVNGNPTGQGLDVDFIAWGPFNSSMEGCDNLNPGTSIGCSYSIAAVENFSIPNAMSGEVYILLITNFDGDSGFISLQQTNFGVSGTGSTDCDIVLECTVTIDGGDQTFCGVDDATLTTSSTGPIESYQWFRNDVLLTGETNDSLFIIEGGDYKVVVDGTECDTVEESVATIIFEEAPCAIPVCSNIDFEENFGTGTARDCDLGGATTTYTCNQTTEVNDGEYSIINTSDGLNAGWHPGMEDHTVGDTDGRALFVNAAFDPGEFYRNTITLTENSDFFFNAWITTVYDTDTAICPNGGIPSNVIFRIEDTAGAMIAETSTGDIPNGSDVNWQQYTINFNTGANSQIQLVLINNSIGGCGNDLAIDDITLTREGGIPEVTTPPSLIECDANGNSSAVFNLEQQTPLILDGLNQADFNVTYHQNIGDAELDINPIATPGAYTNLSNPETMYVRVERVAEESCFATVAFDLEIFVELDITTNLPNELDVCAAFDPLDATPTNAGVDLTTVTYSWKDGSGNEVSTDATYSPTDVGLFTVTVTILPCSEETFTIDVQALSSIEVTVDNDFKTCPNEPNTLTATTTAANATFQWSLNGTAITGATSASLDIMVAPEASGTQVYSVVVTAGLCSGTDEVNVELYDIANCIISQGLSPNGSPGFNDSLDLEFLADRSGISKVQIYNRLGTEVYAETNYINQWRGQTNDGDDLPTGTYFYVIDFEADDPLYGRQATGWIYLNQDAK